MATSKNDGNCFICGQTMSKTKMKNHIIKEHMQGDEECVLVKIEGGQGKKYWLFVDIPKKSTLDVLDQFLREIWMECCGHMSTFSVGRYEDAELAMSRKLSAFPAGSVFNYEYDMGSTTESLITVVAETGRPKQKSAVRLLARNEPFAYKCTECGKPAVHICQECMWETDDAYYCKKCGKDHECDMLISITNSPRCGECGYDGETDTFVFDEKKFA